ncbi:MAG: Rpn family recombination-promoting nuclease/putative transposase [Bacteroidaceae bacterium]|nr:Rpn family recombination-promoting nuclease/putative transposase [Bacteroidaceae bacterium]
MPVDTRERYINPYTDFGFKKLFGTEMNKDLLISFLNALLEGEKNEIIDVQYLNSEHLGDGYGDRRAVFDVYCKTRDGSRFIVEMQKAEQSYFKDRSLYYSTFAIREQAPKGEWDYHLDDVYTVGILNFEFPHGEYPSDSYRHEIKLKDVEDNHVFYDKLTFIYLEMPKFTKTEDELETMFDKWMFVLHNLYRLLDRPKELQDRVFQKLFDQAEIARYTETERRQYEESKKVFWDNFSVIKTARDKGLAEGIAKGMAKGLKQGLQQGREEGLQQGREEEAKSVALKLKAMNLPIEQIAQATGLTIAQITSL